ncbi:MAG: EamA family transporter [Candidatus Dormibacteria bacterium]
MDVLLSLAAALGYGASDFLAGLAGRRGSVAAVGLLGQPFGLLAALVGLWLIPWSPPTLSCLLWGLASGVGSGLGILSLYRGLARGRMAVVAPLAGILTALLPAAVGLALGNRPGLVALLGIALGVPAVALVSWQRGTGFSLRSGVLEGVMAGACFALLFIALDRAGTRSGTWPLVPGQALAVLLIAVAALRSRRQGIAWSRLAPLALAAGALGGSGNVLFLSATGRGQLAVVAVITSLYPAVTVILARLGLGERWGRTQAIGLGMAVVAVGLISL